MKQHDRLYDHLRKLGFSDEEFRAGNISFPFAPKDWWHNIFSKECWIITITSNSWALRHLRLPNHSLTVGGIDELPTEEDLAKAKSRLVIGGEKDGM